MNFFAILDVGALGILVADGQEVKFFLFGIRIHVETCCRYTSARLSLTNTENVQTLVLQETVNEGLRFPTRVKQRDESIKVIRDR